MDDQQLIEWLEYGDSEGEDWSTVIWETSSTFRKKKEEGIANRNQLRRLISQGRIYVRTCVIHNWNDDRGRRPNLPESGTIVQARLRNV